MIKKRIAVLISGSGSNLQALIEACKLPEFPAEIALVISNKTDAYGLVRARDAGILAEVIDHKNFATREAFDEAIEQRLQNAAIEFICLAGFMRVLSESMVARWQGRMINIHPSLLPKYKGLDTHARALQAGDQEAGCSVHYVSAGVDEGDIIMQARVPIIAGDTAETLATRVLKEEHRIYPEALRILLIQANAPH